ncbi:MAG: tetratricopeptide repeat protein [Flavobacteriales bacterium]|nr:tetratricopeptide repeat protein [Flavobacteriales bacterium]
MKIFLLFWFLSLGLFGLGQEPEIKEEYYECATNAMQTDDYSSAIRYLTLIIALDQQDSSAYFDRGVAREHLGDFDSAIIDYTTQISIDSENTDSYFLRGILEELNDNFSLAILDYKKVVELEFGNADAHFFLARCKEAINDTSEIIVEYSNAIEVNPEHAEAYVCRGWYYARKQDFSKALSDISKGLTINPDLSKGYYYKGWVLAKEGRFEESINCFTSAFRVDKAFQTNYDYEVIFEKNAKKLQMKLKKALISHTRISSEKDLVFIGSIYCLLGFLDEAEIFLRKAILEKQNDDIAWFQLAWVELKRKSYEKALTAINHAVEQNPSNKKYYLFRSKIESELNYFDAASKDKAMWQKLYFGN